MPSGTPVFDAASWNGIAIDSTCGGHGTCKKCKVRIVSGEVPVGDIDPRAFTADELRDGWRLACRRPPAERPRRRGATAADAAEGRAGRRRAPRDPAAVGAEAPSRARGADDGGPALRSPARARRDSTTSSRTPRSSCSGRSGGIAAHRELRRHRGRLRRGADRRRAGRHDRAAVRDRVRPRHDDRRRDAGRPRERPAGRGALDAQPPAALRRRRDHPDLGDDDGRRRPRRAARARPRDAVRAGRARCAPRPTSSRARSTRSPSAATSR